jgi:PAS domain S-box-containing protein
MPFLAGSRNSIQSKLTRMNLLVSASALIIVSTAFVVFQVRAFREELVRNTSIQAQMAGLNSASALEFDDSEAANRTLSALQASPNILSATIYTNEGAPFAFYSVDGSGPSPKPAVQLNGRPEVHWFTLRYMGLVSPVKLNHNTIGSIYIRASLEDLSRTLILNAAISVISFLLALIAALALSSVFQRGIARPIAALAGLARTVAREKKYSVRAPVTQANDEIDVLVEAFNEMLAQIQERDAALREASERLNVALKSSGVGAWTLDLPSRTASWDAFMPLLFGLPEGEPIDGVDNVLKLIDPRDLRRINQALRASVDFDAPYDVEFRVIWPNGEVHSLSARGKVARDESGAPLRLAGVCLDVTTRKRAEEERQKFVSLIEQTADFIGIAGLDGKLIYLNRGGRELLEIPAEKALGLSFSEFIPEPFGAKMRDEILPELLRGSTNWEGEGELRHPVTGRTINVLMNVIVIADPESGRPLNFAIMMRDITERKHLEEQLRQSQKLDSLGQLAGGVAHDFNNLLTVITGYAGMILLDLDADNPLRESVSEISLAADRASALTRQLLSFSRRQVTQLKNVIVNDLVRNIERMLRRLIGEDVELVLHLAPEAGALRADPGHIEQVIVNLVVNARDAIPNGGRVLVETAHISVDEELAASYLNVPVGDYVMLAVSDTGIGMTDEVKSHIFEPFFTTKEKGKGTGLGLSTVYGLVTQSHGTVSVYSQPGQGTVFKILFPAVAPETTAEAPAVGTLDLSGTETILVAEDESGIRRYLRQVLDRNGYRTLEAVNGRHAMEIAQAQKAPIDLLVTDVVMPETGGLELADQFAARYPGVPILFMSGYTDRLWSRTNINFLQKPFNSLSLLTRVRTLLDEAKGRVGG